MSEFREIEPGKLDKNIFEMIGRQWMLVTAGNREKFNTMTASWGCAGVLWGRNVAVCFIRPQRYTFRFMENYPEFTLSFFDENFRAALNLCGSKSGRDIDKVKATGLTPAFDGESVYFSEARIVLQCKKIYFDDFHPGNFLDPSIFENYANHDFHRIYIGEIKKTLIR